MFDSVYQVLEELGKQQYIADKKIATVVFLAHKLEKPVLVEGPAGVGKTELAKVVSAATSRTLIRLQCYEGLDEAKALYEWEYAKQMLYTQLLREKLQQVLSDARTLTEAADRLAREENVFFSERFLLERPLLQAIRAEEPTLLLIDEIDRADAEFEAFLLEMLSDFQVSIPELGTIRAKRPPAVILTSNNTRELSEALKRRCLYIFIDYPSADAELEVVRIKVPGLADELAKETVQFVQKLRGMDLKKRPSVSETIDWAKALLMLNAEKLDEDTLNATLSVILKHEQDILRSRRSLEMERRRSLDEHQMESEILEELESDLRRKPRRRKRGPGGTGGAGGDPFPGFEPYED